MNDFSYSVDKKSDRAVLHLSGQVDLAAAPTLDEAIADAEDAGHVELQLSEVSFMDSSGLRILISANDRIRSKGGHLVLVSPSTAVQRILDITGLASSFTTEHPRAAS